MTWNASKGIAYTKVQDVVLLTFLCMIFWAGTAEAQNICSGASGKSDKVICVMPQLFGPNGAVLPNPFHSAHFLFSAASILPFPPLTTAVGSQLTLIPIASPASGIIFVFDRSLVTFVPFKESLGPILTERSETISRHKLFVAGTYQHFGFDTIDGVDLHAIPAVFTHADVAPPPLPSPGNPAFELDWITTNNRISLRIEQFTAFATFGITNRIDASIAVPILDVKMDAVSQATLVRHSSASPVFGYAHFFDPRCTTLIVPIPASVLACQAASTQMIFSNSGHALGIGDVVVRAKSTLWKGERAGIAAAVDVRLPTGDERNFLGTGALGMKPFVIVSYRARVSPHLNVGYQWNGNSILAGDLLNGVKGKLPDVFVYSGGLDVGVNKRLSASFDLLGQHVFDGLRLVRTTYTDLVGVNHPDIPQTSFTRSSFNANNAAVGAKLSPWRNLVLTGNLFIKLDDGGLRAKLIPLGGISYTF